MLKIKNLNIKIIILIVGSVLFISGIFLYLNLKNTKKDFPAETVVSTPEKKGKASAKKIIKKDIPQLVKWKGQDPYPYLDWDDAKPELHEAVIQFENKWGKKLTVLQAYRSAEYGDHIRSVWEIWRYINGRSFTEGQNCQNKKHIDVSKIGVLNSDQKSRLKIEATRHGFTRGDTPPSCDSDHSLGIAVDIVPPADLVVYGEWIKVANESGLCHYIAGDEPHFGLKKYLPEGVDCFA